MIAILGLMFLFFSNDTATTEIYTLSLHDALPICVGKVGHALACWPTMLAPSKKMVPRDRKSTRNSSHLVISYAVFCLKKKKKGQFLGILLGYELAGHMQATLNTAAR